jgi:hypothetical protein
MDHSIAMDAKTMHESASRDACITLELPKEVLVAIRNEGVYDEITIDPTSGKILEQIHLAGRYDSYSDTYHLNGGRWKVAAHRSWPSGEDTYVMKLEERRARIRGGRH